MILTAKGLEGMSREGLVEGLIIAEAENSRIRAILLALAGRPEITADTRKWLADTIKDPKAFHLVNDPGEEEQENFRKFKERVERLVDHVRTAMELPAGQHPDTLWYGKADGYADAVMAYLNEVELPRTMVELKAGK